MSMAAKTGENIAGALNFINAELAKTGGSVRLKAEYGNFIGGKFLPP